MTTSQLLLAYSCARNEGFHHLADALAELIRRQLGTTQR